MFWKLPSLKFPQKSFLSTQSPTLSSNPHPILPFTPIHQLSPPSASSFRIILYTRLQYQPFLLHNTKLVASSFHSSCCRSHYCLPPFLPLSLPRRTIPSILTLSIYLRGVCRRPEPGVLLYFADARDTIGQWCQGEQNNCPILCGGLSFTKANNCTAVSASSLSLQLP